MKLISRPLAVTCLIVWMSGQPMGLAQVQLRGIVVQQATDRTSDSPAEELPTGTPIVEDLSQALGDDAIPSTQTEVVTERYDNGKVKTQREVVQDADQNYVNHGKWVAHDTQGRIHLEGQYKYGERNGVWTRVYFQRDVELLHKAPFNEGKLPLVSQAEFQDGQLHGRWVIFDSAQRKLCEWRFTDGQRDGLSQWWYINATEMREIPFSKGVIHGTLKEWDRRGKQVTSHQYIDGGRLEHRTENYSSGTKRVAGTVLFPALVQDTPDDWLECSLATYSQSGDPVRHGLWTSWYENGQKKLEGNYVKDVHNGEFTWWHSNGQKSLQASYQEGKKHGSWVWWHSNGLKSIQGEYAADTPINQWLWWKETGRVADRADFNDPDQQQILAMPNEAIPNPSASKPSGKVVK